MQLRPTDDLSGDLGSGAHIPPWLWFWTPLVLYFAPNDLSQIRDDFTFILDSLQSATSAFGLLGSQDWLALPAAALEAALSMVLIVGAFLCLLPWLRRHTVEWRYRLSEPAPDYPSAILDEIKTFLAEHAPGVLLKVCLTDRTNTAMVYPLGFRQRAVGVFGGLLVTWRQDRETGQAILLHELAHIRHGEVLFVGAGSPLLFILRYLPILVLTCVVAPLILMTLLAPVFSMIEEMQSYRETADEHAALAERLIEDARIEGASPAEIDDLRAMLDQPTLEMPGLWALFSQKLMIYLPVLPQQFLVIVAFVLAAFDKWVVLAAAIWCSEFNADRVAATSRRGALAAWLENQRSDRRWWRRFTGLFAHPPIPWRRFALRHIDSRLLLVALLLLYPAAYFLQLALMLGWSTLTYSQQGFPAAALQLQVRGWVGAYMASLAPGFVVMAVILAVWPVAAPYWERLALTGIRPRRPAGAGAYLATAVFIACFVIFLPRTSEVPATDPKVTTSKPIFTPDEKIELHFSGMSGHSEDWITLVPTGTPDDAWGDWTYIGGQSEGTLSWSPREPGAYEIRAYFGELPNNMDVRARHIFEVKEKAGAQD